jgi:hypothetical protein
MVEGFGGVVEKWEARNLGINFRNLQLEILYDGW